MPGPLNRFRPILARVGSNLHHPTSANPAAKTASMATGRPMSRTPPAVEDHPREPLHRPVDGARGRDPRCPAREEPAGRDPTAQRRDQQPSPVAPGVEHRVGRAERQPAEAERQRRDEVRRDQDQHRHRAAGDVEPEMKPAADDEHRVLDDQQRGPRDQLPGQHVGGGCRAGAHPVPGPPLVLAEHEEPAVLGEHVAEEDRLGRGRRTRRRWRDA